MRELTERELIIIANIVAEGCVKRYIEEMKQLQNRRLNDKKAGSDYYQGLVLKTHIHREEIWKQKLNDVLGDVFVTYEEWQASYRKYGGSQNNRINPKFKLDTFYLMEQNSKKVSKTDVEDVLRYKIAAINQLMKLEETEKIRDNMFYLQSLASGGVNYQQILNYFKVSINDSVIIEKGINSGDLYMFEGWDGELYSLVDELDGKYNDLLEWIKAGNK